jgi:hypothetical protein
MRTMTVIEVYWYGMTDGELEDLFQPNGIPDWAFSQGIVTGQQARRYMGRVWQ